MNNLKFYIITIGISIVSLLNEVWHCFLLYADFINTQNFISVITKSIDFFVLLIVDISVIQTIIPATT
jgi:hypothetical protein